MLARLMTMRSQFETLQMQFSTGQKADTWGKLGADRSVSLTFNQRIGALDSYASTMTQVALRMKLMDTSLDRLGEIPTDVKAALDPNIYNVRSDGKTDGQKAALIALDEAIGLLNADSDGRYLFAGQDTGSKPVVDLDTMLHGSGGKAGLDTFIAERAMADLGAPDGTGAQMGRLAVTQAGGVVTLEKPVATDFGFAITAATGTLSNVTVTPTGSPPSEIAFDFTGQPAAGETIKVALTNPDGTTTTVSLKATAAADGGAGTFQIGATPDDTAANFAAALGSSIAGVARTDLRAASAIAAGNNFFDTQNGTAPQRVVPVGGDLYAATALADGDPADTVIWYTGQNDPTASARGDVSARIDGSVTVSYGARANEGALASVVKSLAVVSVETFDPAVASDAGRYRALTERVRSDLSFPDGAPAPRDVQAEIAVAAKAVQLAEDRNRTTKAAYKDIVGEVEQVDDEEVAAKLLALQTQMEASYKTIAMLSELSLVNYV
jgi:flagellin-like hook-associated protein FlgL